MIVGSSGGECQYPDAVGAVEQGHEQANAAGHGLFDQLVTEEGPPGHGAVNRFRRPDHQPSPRKRQQGQLLIVLQQDGHVSAADSGNLLGYQRGDQLWWHLVRPVDHGAQETLTEALRAVNARRATSRVL